MKNEQCTQPGGKISRGWKRVLQEACGGWYAGAGFAQCQRLHVLLGNLAWPLFASITACHSARGLAGFKSKARVLRAGV